MLSAFTKRTTGRRRLSRLLRCWKAVCGLMPCAIFWVQSSDGFDLRQAKCAAFTGAVEPWGHCPILRPWPCSVGVPPASSNHALLQRRIA